MKTIRYPHMWRYRWFHWYQVCIVLKFVYVSSKHPRVFLESLRQFSAILGHLQTLTEIVGTCSGTFVWPSEQFWKIFGNHQESGLKSSENHQKRHHQYVHIIKRALQVEDMNFKFSWQEQYLTRSLRSLWILFSPFEHKIDFFSPPCNILYIIYRKEFIATKHECMYILCFSELNRKMQLQ